MHIKTSDEKKLYGISTIQKCMNSIKNSKPFINLTIKYPTIYANATEISDQKSQEEQILRDLQEMKHCQRIGEIYLFDKDQIFAENFSKHFISFCIVFFFLDKC